MSLLDAVRLATGTLTVLPAGPVSRIDRRTAGRAMLLAPFVVLPLAAGAAAAGWLGHLSGLPALACGLLVVAGLALGTRGLHLDGLGSGWDRAKALAVMRRGDVGPMGVAALVLVLGLQAVAMGELASSWRGAVELAALIGISRSALSIACRQGVRPARADGLGRAVAGAVPRWAVGVTWLGMGAALALLFGWRSDPWWLGVCAAALSVLVVSLLVRRCVRRFGGVTGDVMGASVELALTVLVLVAAR